METNSVIVPSSIDGLVSTSVDVVSTNGSETTLVRKDNVAKLPVWASRLITIIRENDLYWQKKKEENFYEIARILISEGHNEAWVNQQLGEFSDMLVVAKVNGNRKAKDVMEFNEEYASSIKFNDVFADENLNLITDETTALDVYNMIVNKCSIEKHIDAVEGKPTLMCPLNSIQDIKEVK